MSQWRLQEAVRKAAAELPDKPKVSDAVFSKILLLMKWKRTAKEQADARPFTMAARRTRLQQMRALTARMSVVQGTGFVNQGEELDALVDLTLEKEMAELHERVLAAEEHKSKSFTSPSDIQRRMRAAMQGVRLWRTSSLGDDDDDSSFCGAPGERADGPAAALLHHQAAAAASGMELLAGQWQQQHHLPLDGAGANGTAMQQQRLTSGGDSCGSGAWTAGSGGSSLSDHSRPPRASEDTWAQGPEFAAFLSSAGAQLDLQDPRTPDPAAGHATAGLAGGGGGGSFLLRSLPSQRLAGSHRFLRMQSMSRADSLTQMDPLSAEQQAGQQRRRAGLLGDGDHQSSGISARSAAAVTESLLSLDSAAGVRLVTTVTGGGGSSSNTSSPFSTPAPNAAGGPSALGMGPPLQRLLSRRGSSFAAPPLQLVRQPTFRDAAASSALASLESGVYGVAGAEGASNAGVQRGSEPGILGAKLGAAAGTAADTGAGRAHARVSADGSEGCEGTSRSRSAAGDAAMNGHVRWTRMTIDGAGGEAMTDAFFAAHLARSEHRSPSRAGARPRVPKVGATSGTCSPAPGSRSQCSSPSPAPLQPSQQPTVSHLTFSWGTGLVASGPSSWSGASEAVGGQRQYGCVPHPGLQSLSRRNLTGRSSPGPPAARREQPPAGGLGSDTTSSPQQQQQLPALLPSPTAAARMAGVSAVRRFVSASLDSATSSPLGRGGCASPTPPPVLQQLHHFPQGMQTPPQSHLQAQLQLQQALLQYGRATSPGPLAARRACSVSVPPPAATTHNSHGSGADSISGGVIPRRTNLALGNTQGGGMHMEAPMAQGRASPMPFGAGFPAGTSVSPAFGGRGDGGARSPFGRPTRGPK